MRRHRSPPSERSGDDSNSGDRDHRHRHVMIQSLDLNLPAPPEEFSKPRLVFAAVVDCHY